MEMTSVFQALVTSNAELQVCREGVAALCSTLLELEAGLILVPGSRSSRLPFYRIFCLPYHFPIPALPS